MDDYRVIGIEELSHILPYKISTIKRLITQEPHKLPPRIATMGRPAWYLPAIKTWLANRSHELRVPRKGRPRKLV
ncbi:hypothetical protein COMNV_01330 [Commensalibacter sp. Nvir]|uniref:hypothetical protein n=1 Tax=Commensalibacter sp. Nvir TaxID=3069817 RepID=UPI002D291E19|nr:hypothetical protein COMNV_01330 [Commensalibacter sp. Nvir]